MISKAVALKGAGALGAATAASGGVYYAVDRHLNLLSKYDRELINFLEAKEKENDIVFEVKKGEDDFNESHLTFSSTGPTKFTVKASVQISQGTSSQTFFSGNTSAQDADLKKIKELNGGNWTWECNIEFSTTVSNGTLKDDYKNAISKETKKGLFGILKSKISEHTNGTTGKITKEDLRKIKVDFIRKCGEARGLGKNKEHNNKTETVSSLKITTDDVKIEFVNGTESGDANKLVPKEKSTFEYWFKPEYWNKF